MGVAAVSSGSTALILGVGSIVARESSTVGGTGSGQGVKTASVGTRVVDGVVTTANVSARNRVSENACTTAKICVGAVGRGPTALEGCGCALGENGSVTAKLRGCVIRSVGGSWDSVVLSAARFSAGKSISSTTVECVRCSNTNNDAETTLLRVCEISGV